MGTRIFVGNLSFERSEQDLHDLFNNDGRSVGSVSIVTDRDSGRSRGFGFVEMAAGTDSVLSFIFRDSDLIWGIHKGLCHNFNQIFHIASPSAGIVATAEAQLAVDSRRLYRKVLVLRD